VTFRHTKIFLPDLYYDYIVLNKSKFILKGLCYRLALIFDISDHPLKNWKIKPYNAVGSLLAEQHSLESVRGEFGG
jgi:hypothetical protein